MSKKKLLIVSDLWGQQKSQWTSYYTDSLRAHFDVHYYDSCMLGDVYISDYRQEQLHRQFVQGGIDVAVEKLIELEKEGLTILAFSIGGTIAWQYGLRSGRIDNLICVSATRIRKEADRPNGNVHLYYGENDPYKPAISWLDKMNVHYQIDKNQAHDYYMDKACAALITDEIIDLYA